MKIVFMGTPEFAVPSLQKLSREHEIMAVITAPDRPAGRGKKVQQPEVKKAAETLGIRVLQPTNLKDVAFQQDLKAINADLFVVLAFRMLPESVWSIPANGTINLHASLLPQYRGAAPINHAIINGETTTGLTTFFIEKDIDTGNIIDQVSLEIGADENAGALHDRMMQAGADLLSKTVLKIEKGKVMPKPQPTVGKLNPAPKIFRENCQIDWSLSAYVIHNFVRGLSPYPAAWTRSATDNSGEEVFKIFKTSLSDRTLNNNPGEVSIENSELFVNTGFGTLKILELQSPGKRRMDTSEFLRGFKEKDGFKFM